MARARQPASLFELGPELHELMASNLDARSLARLGASCKAFRAFGIAGSPGSCIDSESMRLVERAARLQLLRACSGDIEAATRHRRGPCAPEYLHGQGGDRSVSYTAGASSLRLRQGHPPRRRRCCGGVPRGRDARGGARLTAWLPLHGPLPRARFAHDSCGMQAACAELLLGAHEPGFPWQPSLTAPSDPSTCPATPQADELAGAAVRGGERRGL